MITNPAWWALGVTVSGGVLTWATLIIRLMWNFRGKWDETNGTLAGVREQLASLVARDAAIEQRLERHLDWHDWH